ncbi:MAG: class B sortase [Lachnospiraceae bacterium]|jgi:sortase B|uniref:class B sortase n=1 Tax=Candidatus Merdisoma sp. JLR.KK006 TaxID=3112626 RepID=UPI002FF221A8|nr:class B sortase [Lachnospiraceae bacterium]
MRRKKRRRVPIVLIVALVLCLGMVIFCGSQLAGIFLEYKEGTDEYDELKKYVEKELPDVPYNEDTSAEEGEEVREQRIAFEELKAQNEDVIGWIEIPDTEISYPLMQGDDDQYYLKHTFSGNKNSAGSIFVEYQNKPDLTDRHTIIYGHNMKNGSMFGGLKEYRNASYLVDHPMVYIDLEDGTHAYQIFSCYETPANSNTYTIGFASQPDGRYEQFVQTLKNSSAYDTGIDVSKNDRVITLSTCTKRSENRFVVHAKRIY